MVGSVKCLRSRHSDRKKQYLGGCFPTEKWQHDFVENQYMKNLEDSYIKISD